MTPSHEQDRFGLNHSAATATWRPKLNPAPFADDGHLQPREGKLESMIILCADDYALTEGISRAIGELAAAQRLSATSVLVTSAHWPAGAPRLCVHRGHLSVGLHLDLTLGTPLGAMPGLAPGGKFLGLRGLLARALLGLLDVDEVRAEIGRQLDRFEAGMRAPPDHIDGHQHVHVLSGVRQALLETVQQRYPSQPPLIRDPSDRLRTTTARGAAVPKAIMVGALAFGFARAAQRKRLPVNDSFAGFSNFDVREPYADELQSALSLPGRRHLVMCHPGHPDAELAGLDSVVERRRMEYEALMRDPGLPHRIWRPSRSADGPTLAWADLQG
jgi:chitin disaccharide deacetylase